MRIADPNAPTKKIILDATVQLMLRKGYTATSVENICMDAKTTKGSFFHFFENKEDLGQAALEHFYCFMQEEIREGPFLKKSDPLERVYGYVDFIILISQDPRTPKSCLLGNFAQELSNTHSGIRASCARLFSHWTNELKQDLQAAQAKHAPKRTFNAGVLAEHFVAVLEGALILAKAKKDRKIVKKSLLCYKQYLEGLFEK